MGVALVGIEVSLAVEVGVFGKRSGLGTFLLSDAVVRTEQCTGNTINGGVQLLAAVSVEYLCRGHVVSTQSQLHVVHLLHQCTVIRTGTVRIVHLDSDGADRGTAVLDAYLLLCSEFHCLVVLGKNGFVAVIHLADLFARMQHDNALGFLCLAFLVLDCVGKCRCTLVRDGDSLNHTVCPRTVGEVQIPVHKHLCLLVLDILDIVGIVYLAIRHGCTVLAQIGIRSACLNAYHHTTVNQLLHIGARFRHTLCRNVCHHLVLLILGKHSLRVGKVHNVVVECLYEIVVGIPPYNLIQIQVCIRTVEVDGVVENRECAAGVDRHTRCHVTVLEHFTQHHTTVRSACLRLYHDVKSVHHIVKI